MQITMPLASSVKIYYIQEFSLYFLVQHTHALTCTWVYTYTQRHRHTRTQAYTQTHTHTHSASCAPQLMSYNWLSMTPFHHRATL